MAGYEEFKPTAENRYDYPALFAAFMDKLGVDMSSKGPAVHDHGSDPPILEVYPDGGQGNTGGKHLGVNTTSNQVEVIDTDGNVIARSQCCGSRCWPRTQSAPRSGADHGEQQFSGGCTESSRGWFVDLAKWLVDSLETWGLPSMSGMRKVKNGHI